MEKLLTIIIPTYNMEKYLNQCLDSLLTEKARDLLDILVVIDGSKDRSSEIAHGYADKYPETVRVIDKENGNYGSCINRGIIEGRGKYVKILDADDRYDITVLDDYLDALAKVDVDLFLSDTLQVTEDGETVKEIRLPMPAGEILSFDDYSKVDELPMHSIAYRLENVRKLGYRQTEGISYTDTEWAFFPMQAVKTCCYFPKPLYRYLIGRAGQTMAPEVYKRGRSQELIITKRMVEFWDVLPVEGRAYFDQYLLHRLRRIYMQNMVRNEDGDNEFLIEMDKFIKDHSTRLYELLDECLYGRREKIPFIREWRKKYKPSLKFRLCVMFHKIMGKQK
jgi:glycosyltransferase involved in cell wall biosynthesis